MEDNSETATLKKMPERKNHLKYFEPFELKRKTTTN